MLEIAFLVTPAAVLTDVIMGRGSTNPILVVQLLILHVQPALIVIVFGAIQAIMALLEVAVPDTQVVVLTDVMMDLGIMYLIAVHQHLLILLAQQVLLVIVFGVTQAIIAHQGLVPLATVVAALTGVMMVLGIMYLIVVYPLRIILVLRALIAIVFGVIGHTEVILGLVALATVVAALTDVMMVLGIMYLIAVHHHHLRLLLAQLVRTIIVTEVVEVTEVIQEVAFPVIQAVVLTDVTMDYGVALNLILVVQRLLALLLNVLHTAKVSVIHVIVFVNGCLVIV